MAGSACVDRSQHDLAAVYVHGLAGDESRVVGGEEENGTDEVFARESCPPQCVLVRLTAQGSRVARQALHEVVAANEVFLKPLNSHQRESIASALKLLLLHHEPR